MARHMCDPTAGRELAGELAPYSVEGPELASRSVARLRRDLDPRLATLLEIDSGWDNVDAIAALIAGRTACGADVAGIEHAAPQRNLAETLGLEADRLPTRAEIARVAAGLRADDGAPLLNLAAARRLFRLFGLKEDRPPDEAEQAMMASGRRPDGRALRRGIAGALTKHPGAGISALLISINAPKSLSVGVALAPGAERAILLNAHQEAAAQTMDEVDRIVGHVRRGDGGRFELPASTCWITLTHFTARPTTADRVSTRHGLTVGDPQIHEQVLMLTAALDDDGRPGKIDTGALHHHVKTLGATYQMLLAARLRRADVAVSLDHEQDCARLDLVPGELVNLFSKRTVTGREKAKAFAAREGLDLTAAGWSLSTALVKGAVQGDPRAPRRDDVGDLASWRSQAATIGARLPALAVPGGVRVQGRGVPVDARAIARNRLVALASKRPMSIRTAAALALIEVADAEPGDVGRVAAALQPLLGEAPHVPATRPLDSATVRAKAGDGSAILVGGGREAVVAAAAALWIARRSPSGVAMPVAVAREQDLRDVGDEIRQRLRERGSIGPDVKIVRTLDGDGLCRATPLARGESVVFTANVNGVIDGKAGRVGSAGSPVVVTAIDDAGLNVSTSKGARAVVKWPSLYDAETRTMAIAHGYAALWPCRADAMSVVAVLEGSAQASRLGLPSTATIVFDRDAELALDAPTARAGEDEGHLEDGRLWNAIVARLDRRARLPVVERLEAARRETTLARLASILKVERGGTAADPWAPLRRRTVARALAGFEGAVGARTAALVGLVTALAPEPLGASPARLPRAERGTKAAGGAKQPAPRGPDVMAMALPSRDAARQHRDASPSAPPPRRAAEPLPAASLIALAVPPRFEQDDDAVVAASVASASIIDRVSKLRSIVNLVRRASIRATLESLLVRLETVLAATTRMVEEERARAMPAPPGSAGMTNLPERTRSQDEPRRVIDPRVEGRRPRTSAHVHRGIADEHEASSAAKPKKGPLKVAKPVVHTTEEPVSATYLSTLEPLSSDWAPRVAERLRSVKRHAILASPFDSIARTLEARGGTLQRLGTGRAPSPNQSRRPQRHRKRKDGRGL